MAWNPTGSVWQYSRWVYNIARNSRITNPTGAELAAVKTYLKAIYDPTTQTGTRTWLADDYNKKSVSGADNYQCDIDVEPTPVLIEILAMVGKDLKNNPMTNAEKALSDTLIAATGVRRYGDTPYFGGVGGSTVA